MKTRILVINLNNDVERRESFIQRAENAKVDWSFFPAHTTLYSELCYDETAAIIAKGRPLSQGEIGCYSSHYAAWTQFREHDIDQMIIFEDDAIVDWAYIAKLSQTDLSNEGIHYLRLYYKAPTEYRIIKNNFLQQERFVIELSGYPFGTQGYAVTRAGAMHLMKHCKVVRRPVDDELDRSWKHGIPNLSLFPFPIFEQTASSAIGEGRFSQFAIPKKLQIFRLWSLIINRAERHVQTLTGYGRYKRVLSK